MGLSASSDEWCQCSDWIVEGLPWAMKIVDDTLVWASDLQTLEERVTEVLERCKQINITISKKKFEIADQLIFAGYIFGAEGIKPDPEKVECIQNFPQPTSATDIRSFLGMANQNRSHPRGKKEDICTHQRHQETLETATPRALRTNKDIRVSKSTLLLGGDEKSPK